MKLGFSSMNTPEELAPDRLARALEDRGYDSFWIGEHSHIPVSRKTPYPSGGDLPESYKRMMDPFISLTMAASATSSLVVGTSVILALEHDIFQLAKKVATLDRLSGGRLQVGVGAGWNEEELANHRDVPWRQRYGALAEAVGALRALWTEEESSFHGRFYDFDPVWAYPKPLQQPHPPILCGMAGRVGTVQTLTWADEWMPMDIALGKVERRLTSFRRALEEAGRDPATFPITIVAFGNPEQATLEHYRELGVRRTVLGAARQGWDDPETTLPFLDHYAPMVEALA
jgi:probable F420-dependent oxidoreductase